MSSDLWIGCGGIIVTFLVTWGAMRAKQSELEKRIDKLETQNEEQSAKLVNTREDFSNEIHDLKNQYVSQVHFDETIAMLKENHRDIKEDVKKVLDLLSSR